MRGFYSRVRELSARQKRRSAPVQKGFHQSRGVIGVVVSAQLSVRQKRRNPRRRKGASKCGKPSEALKLATPCTGWTSLRGTMMSAPRTRMRARRLKGSPPRGTSIASRLQPSCARRFGKAQSTNRLGLHGPGGQYDGTVRRRSRYSVRREIGFTANGKMHRGRLPCWVSCWCDGREATGVTSRLSSSSVAWAHHVAIGSQPSRSRGAEANIEGWIQLPSGSLGELLRG